MIDLDNKEEIRKLDKSNLMGSIEGLREQIEDAIEQTREIEVPKSFGEVKAVVMAGMGGSGLGARVIESVYGNEMKVPLIRINDYNLPKWVDEKTLVMVSSYSGNTEETLSNAIQAKEKGAKIMAIGAGGKLIEMAKENKWPFYQIEPKYNPSKQPRMAIGYSVTGQLIMASRAGIIEIKEEELKMEEKREIKALAKEMAKSLKDKVIVIVTAQHLVGAGHVVNNQINENAKCLTVEAAIPEMNHHAIEGWVYPESNKEKVVVLFFESDKYTSRISQRVTITKEIVEKLKMKTISFKAEAKTKLAQGWEVIQFGAWVNFYLAMMYGIDPSPIPQVDFLKARLGQVNEK